MNWTLRNKLQWNFNRNTKPFIQENASEIIVCEMAAILSRGRWVKSPVHSSYIIVPLCSVSTINKQIMLEWLWVVNITLVPLWYAGVFYPQWLCSMDSRIISCQCWLFVSHMRSDLMSGDLWCPNLAEYSIELSPVHLSFCMNIDVLITAAWWIKSAKWMHLLRQSKIWAFTG